MTRGVRAGVTAAAVWAAAEPVVQRLFRTSYSDVRLLGAVAPRGRFARPLGLVLHLVNGAVFGAAFERSRLRGWRDGLIAAEVENAALWPAMAIVDRVHPDRRSGAWPPLLANPRVFAYEAVVHGLFGLVLGALLDDD